MKWWTFLLSGVSLAEFEGFVQEELHVRSDQVQAAVNPLNSASIQPDTSFSLLRHIQLQTLTCQFGTCALSCIKVGIHRDRW